MWSCGCISGCTCCCAHAHVDAQVHEREDAAADQEERGRTDVHEDVEMDVDLVQMKSQTWRTMYTNRDIKEKQLMSMQIMKELQVWIEACM